MTAFLLGVVQLSRRRGLAPSHAGLGLDISCLMAVVALSSFLDPPDIAADSSHRVGAPSFSGALVIAGLFTLVPGRIMHTILFGR
jgi:uncharacterized membrane protein